MRYICVDDYEKEAHRRLPKDALDYYRSGADEESTIKDNRDVFNRWKILPRFLRDVSSIDLKFQILGHNVDCPIGVCPTAMHKLAHPDGELATAEGVRQAGTIMILSTLSTTSIEELANKQPKLIKWLQLYLFTDRSESLKLVRRAEEAGFKGLVLTVDAAKFGSRRRDIHNNFKVPAGFCANFDQTSSKGLQNLDYIDPAITWADVDWLRRNSRLPLMVKGILTAEDSQLALDHGVSAIVVSNHGGRQLDTVPATLDVLPSIARQVAGRCPILVDGGVRTGSDVFKCLALGASMVFVGRPVLWGLACEGAQGVASVLQILKDELKLTMMLSGCPRLADITRNMLIHSSELTSKL